MSRGEWASNLTLNWNVLASGILGGYSVVSSVYFFFCLPSIVREGVRKPCWYCTFSPPVGQLGYLQCIITAQAIS
jgi:hypothetical protein